jgi:arylsulfatase A-like enzyme
MKSIPNRNASLHRRRFLQAAAAGAAALAARQASAAPKSPKPPNIIYIMADDLGVYDLGCYGQKLIRTPHVDKLAAEGMRFTQCYAGSAVCAPARSVLMTGQHTGHTRVRGNFGKVGGVGPQRRVPLKKEDVTVAEVLQAAGYATGITGKWGLGEPGTDGVPNKKGFDEWLGYLNQRRAHTYYPDYIWRNQTKLPLPGNAGGKRKQYVHDLFAQFALDFVNKHKDRPFFLYLAHTIPHAKFEIPSDAPYSDRKWPAKLKNYAAMVTRMDRDVGDLMALLKKLALDDNTVVFFCSDNGSALADPLFKSTGPLRSKKGSVYEGGLRVPMIARWPGKIAPGTVSGQVWAFWDFLPTAADLARATPPKNIDGVSIVPVLLGKRKNIPRDFLYWEYGAAQATRMGDWKGVRASRKKPLQLYNLKDDLGEKTNLAAKNPDVVKKIEAIMAREHVASPNWPD